MSLPTIEDYKVGTALKYYSDHGTRMGTYYARIAGVKMRGSLYRLFRARNGVFPYVFVSGDKNAMMKIPKVATHVRLFGALSSLVLEADVTLEQVRRVRKIVGVYRLARTERAYRVESGL